MTLLGRPLPAEGRHAIPLRPYEPLQSGQSAEPSFSGLEHHKADVGDLTQSASLGRCAGFAKGRCPGKVDSGQRRHRFAQRADYETVSSVRYVATNSVIAVDVTDVAERYVPAAAC